MKVSFTSQVYIQTKSLDKYGRGIYREFFKNYTERAADILRENGSRDKVVISLYNDNNYDINALVLVDKFNSSGKKFKRGVERFVVDSETVTQDFVNAYDRALKNLHPAKPIQRPAQTPAQPPVR
jgi:hypothetical protein